MSGVTLIRNPISSQNLNLPSGTRPPVPPGVRLIQPSSLEALSAGLAESRAAGVDLILIDGGDGTVREVLSRVPENWGNTLPRIGILPRGNTNLIAREVGGLRSPEAIAELLRRHASGNAVPSRRHALLRVDYPDNEHPSLRGFMLGWGAYATGTRIAREEIAARGDGQVKRAVLATLHRALIGAERKDLRRGVATGLSVDGVPAADGARLMGLATTLRGPLIAGLNPFWGHGDGAIRWLDIRAPGRWLALATPFVALGWPMGWMRRAGYESGHAARLELELDTPFILDGESFPPALTGPLRLTAEEAIDFVSL
jgi:hypothetical protein